MTGPEFMTWREYFKLFPFDHHHLIHRPAALIAASMRDGNLADAIKDRLEWLDPSPPNGYSDADNNVFRAFGVTPPRRT